jgi:hypothetical protein
VASNNMSRRVVNGMITVWLLVLPLNKLCINDNNNVFFLVTEPHAFERELSVINIVKVIYKV